MLSREESMLDAWGVSGFDAPSQMNLGPAGMIRETRTMKRPPVSSRSVDDLEKRNKRKKQSTDLPSQSQS